MSKLSEFGRFFRHKGIFIVLHIIIMLLSLLLIIMISIDTFHNVKFYTQPSFEKWQFWICVAFMGDFFIELALSSNRKHYLATRWLFFLVAIPYQAIIYHYGWHVSRELSYIIRYVPLMRGGYAMAIVVGWFTSNKATGLFWSYIITLISTVYFASLTFFLFEHGLNPLVKQYKDALWWAAMDVTTVGCNIVAMTGVGRVLSVLLAALGMMMFPIFTVYVTNMLTKRNKEATYTASFSDAFRNYVNTHPDTGSESSGPNPVSTQSAGSTSTLQPPAGSGE